MQGPTGLPGKCPTFCSDACVFGARGILEQARINEKGVLTINSLKEAVWEGNRTAQSIESGVVSVEDLNERKANELYVYLLFKNSVCDASLLGGGPPDSKQTQTTCSTV